MKRFYTISLLGFILLIFHQGKLLAQVISQDSLALVDLYNSTDGANWLDNTNWLSTSNVSGWFGVQVQGQRVTGLLLQSNNLTGQVPGSINNMNGLREISFFDNNLTSLPTLSNLALLEILSVENNKLTFKDLEPNIGFGFPVFQYAPQQDFDKERFLTKEPGSTVTWSTPAGGIFSLYQWYKDGAVFGPPSGDPSLVLHNIQVADNGAYWTVVTNTAVPGLTLNSKNQTLNVGLCVDSLGGVFNCQEMAIRFEPSADPLFKDSLLNATGAVPLDSCNCNSLYLWELPDTLNLEETVKTSQKDPKVEETGNNYVLDLAYMPFIIGDPQQSDPFTPNSPNGNEVVVALIDSGVQWDHPDLVNYMYLNALEYPEEGNDDDGNCLEDDYRGWDFLNNDNDPYDEHGHGTHIAGILAGSGSPEVQIMNLQVFDASGGSSLFKAACAIYYAADQGAKVINTSWGYYGEASELLEAAIRYAGKNCGALVVASAGNDGTNTDSQPHYPSGYDLDNLISVGALSADETSLASYSNYGDSTIDIAAAGTMIYSTVPTNLYDFKDGTSMAAGEVSKAAALLFFEDPSASYRNVKHSLMSTVNPMTNGSDSLITGGSMAYSNALTDLQNSANIGECGALLDLNLFLEGPFDSLAFEMNNGLWSTSSVPLTQPYNIAPWLYNGSETIGAPGLSLSGPDEFVDWVLLIYGDPDDSDATPLIQAALVQKDGDVRDPNGNLINLNSTEAEYLAVVHRNHLGIMSASKVSFDYQPTTVDFSDTATDLYGTNATKTQNGVRVMIGGDASRDGTVNVFDLNAHWRVQNGNPYNYNLSTADFNLDAAINSVDLNKLWRVNNSLINQCPLCY